MAVVDALCLCGPSRAADVGGLAPLFLKRAQGLNVVVVDVFSSLPKIGGGLLARLIRSELNMCASESELFRVPSARSVVVMRYLRLVCQEYVQVRERSMWLLFNSISLCFRAQVCHFSLDASVGFSSF